MIKFGIIGCGRISHRFMQGIKQVTDASLAAAWSRRPESVEQFVSQYGGKACRSLDDLLNSDIDAVYIATLPDSHADYSMSALNAGKHVLCEKPATVNLAQLEPVLQLAKTKGLLRSFRARSPRPSSGCPFSDSFASSHLLPFMQCGVARADLSPT